jgi:hypothetical protein
MKDYYQNSQEALMKLTCIYEDDEFTIEAEARQLLMI